VDDAGRPFELDFLGVATTTQQVQQGLSAIASRISKAGQVPAGGFGRLWSTAYKSPRIPRNAAVEPVAAAASSRSPLNAAASAVITADAWKYRVAYHDLFGQHVGAQVRY
jgi:hypothetical protein